MSSSSTNNNIPPVVVASSARRRVTPLLRNNTISSNNNISLREQITKAQSEIDKLNEMVASQNQIVSRLQFELNDMKECSSTSTRKKGKELGRNPEKAALIRTAYEKIVSETGVSFDFTISLGTGLNDAIKRKLVVDVEELDRHASRNSGLQADKKEIFKRIRNHFDYLKKKEISSRVLTTKQRSREVHLRKLKTRKDRKFQRRNRATPEDRASIAQQLEIPVEDINSILSNRVYMSDEDDDDNVVVESGGRSTYNKRLRPTWRSQMLNLLYDEIDLKVPPAKSATPLRTVETNVEIDRRTLSLLPQWAFRY